MTRISKLLALFCLWLLAAACGFADLEFPDDEGAALEDRTEGLDPTLALRPQESPLETPAPEAAVVEEEERLHCGDTKVRDLYVPDPDVLAEAKGLVSQMSIEQKVLQLTGLPVDYDDFERWDELGGQRDDEALDLRGSLFKDGSRGVNLGVGAGRKFLQNYSTSFPVGVAQGATFDVDLAERIGAAMGSEALSAGGTVLLAPMMNVLSHPRWGRAQETFGEDTFHLGRLATSVTLGIQQYITACAKHFLAYQVEASEYVDVAMSEQTLRESYGRHFEMVVRDGGVGCIVTSYNSVNGTKVAQNKHLLNDVLRKDFGFRGFVVSDLWALPGTNDGQGDQGLAGTEDAVLAIEAGLDVEMPWALHYAALPQLVSQGKVAPQMVDQAVLRVLEQKLRFQSASASESPGLESPDVGYDAELGSVTDTEAHVELAREAAEKAMVLLKNETQAGDTPVLPIQGVTKVAVLGKAIGYSVLGEEQTFDFARDAALGDQGSSRVLPDPALTVGPLAGIEMAAPADVEVIGGWTADDAADADFVVVVVGLTTADESEGWVGSGDRDSLDLSPLHNELITDVVALGKPMVVVVEAGGVVNLPWLSDVPAVVMAWYPGQRGGEALGRLLFGQANFSGRLPVTWPEDESQLPEFVHANYMSGEPTTPDYFVGYKRFDDQDLTPLFAFGHGLSYATFSYERLHIPCSHLLDDGLLQVEVDVRNVGDRAGDEVVMAFASYQNPVNRRPEKELKAFARVHLQPGEAKRVVLPIRARDLKAWSNGAEDWFVDWGLLDISVGPSSDRLLLQQTVEVHGPEVTPP